MKGGIMRQRSTSTILVRSMAMFLLCVGEAMLAQELGRWKPHDMNRPRPPLVKPGSQNLPVPPPADAVILFAGKDLTNWRSEDGGPAKWIAKEGYMESVKGSGYIFSKQTFGDVQLHVEWATP